jgi:hypothetical protein
MRQFRQRRSDVVPDLQRLLGLCDRVRKLTLLLIDLRKPAVRRPKVMFEIEGLAKLRSGFVVSMGIL